MCSAPLFDYPQHATYFNTAGIALCPQSVRHEVEAYLAAFCADPIDSFARFGGCRETLRGRLARLLHAVPAEIAVTHHTAEGAGIVANGLDWKPGDCILSLDREYPSTIYPWMHLEKTRGVRLVLLHEEGGRVEEERIVDAIRRRRPRLVAVSAVEWNSGYRFDLEPIGRACEEVGACFFVDAAQSLGFWDMDVRACRISALAGSAWKWLFGPLGCGYLYLAAEWLERIPPVFVGSESVPNAQQYLPYHFELLPDARRFEYSTAQMAALVWFEAGVRFVQELGLETIRTHVFGLQERAVAGLEALGCALRERAAPERRSGILAFDVPGCAGAEAARRLEERRIVVKERDGFVRVACHLCNTPAGVDRLIGEVADLIP